MKKVVTLMIELLFFISIFVGVSRLNTLGDENYKDHRNKLFPRDQSGPDDIE